MPKKKKIPEKLKHDWWLFCYNYIKLAELGCREMIHQKHQRFYHEKKGHFGGVAFYRYDLYLSTIYCLKHSIEIFLKYFYIVIKDVLPKYDHDIESFLDIFQKEYEVKKINKKIQNAIKDGKSSKYSLEFAEMEIQFTQDWVDDIARITLKYFYCEDIKDKVGTIKIKDVQNDGFRYPENKLKVNLDYTDMVHKISKEDVQIVLKDIYDLKNAFNSLSFLIDVYQEL